MNTSENIQNIVSGIYNNIKNLGNVTKIKETIKDNPIVVYLREQNEDEDEFDNDPDGQLVASYTLVFFMYLTIMSNIK